MTSCAEVVGDEESHDAQLPRARLDVRHQRQLAVLQLAHRHQLAVCQQLHGQQNQTASVKEVLIFFLEGISPGAWLRRLISTALPYLPEIQHRLTKETSFHMQKNAATKVNEVWNEVQKALLQRMAAQHTHPTTEPPGLSYKQSRLGRSGRECITCVSRGTKTLDGLMLHAHQ